LPENPQKDKNPARQNTVAVFFLKVSLLYVDRFITERIIVMIRQHLISQVKNQRQLKNTSTFSSAKLDTEKNRIKKMSG
jgi:hypothetical protein